jgi:DNA polymerase-3 subunit alpha
MAEARLLVWAAVDRRDERVQLIVDDCRAIDDLRLLMVELDPEQASDVAVQHKLRECLQAYRPDQEQLGVRVPVVAAVRQGSAVRYVRLGPQFCVRDASAAALHLQEKAFKVKCSEPLLN